MWATDRPFRQFWRRPGSADLIILAHGLASFCYGLVFPYTAIYLAGKPALGTGGVAVYYAVSGSASLTAALLLAMGWVKLPRVTLGVLGNGLWLAGYLAMSVAGSYPLVIAAAAAIGSGQGCFLAAVIPILNSLIAPENRRRIFARRYAILNGTLAGGSLVGGALTFLLHGSVITYFFLINALGIIPTALAMLASRKRQKIAFETAPASADGPGGDPGGGTDDGTGRAMPTLAILKLTLPVVLFQLAVYMLGFSQFEATGPLVAKGLMRLPLFSVSLMLTVNVLVIVAAQRLVSRLLEGRPEVTGLQVGVGLWAVAYCVVGLLAFAPAGLRLVGLISYAVLFALGECAYSCSFYPWLISTVRESELSRANAMANSMMGIGIFVGPSIGVGLVLSGSAPVVWLSLAACCAAVVTVMGLAARRKLQAQAMTAG